MLDKSAIEVLVDRNNEKFSGSLMPEKVWELIQNNLIKLIDIRTLEERKFVGFIENSIHVPWANGTSFTVNPRFVRELESKVKKDQPIVLLCRSNKRSLVAAEAAKKSGFVYVFSVLEGFEGDLNEHNHRNSINGWKYRNLPWTQD